MPEVHKPGNLHHHGLTGFAIQRRDYRTVVRGHDPFWTVANISPYSNISKGGSSETIRLVSTDTVTIRLIRSMM